MAKEGTFIDPRKARRHSTLQPVAFRFKGVIAEAEENSSKDSLTSDSDIENSKESPKK